MCNEIEGSNEKIIITIVRSYTGENGSYLCKFVLWCNVFHVIIHLKNGLMQKTLGYLLPHKSTDKECVTQIEAHT